MGNTCKPVVDSFQYMAKPIQYCKVKKKKDVGLIPGLGRSPGRGNGNPHQCSCLENPMDGGTRWATVHGATESDTTEVT